MPLADILGVKKVLYNKNTSSEQLDAVLKSCLPPAAARNTLDSFIPNRVMSNMHSDEQAGAYTDQLRKQRGQISISFIYLETFRNI